jgi:uncharacterized protein YndB with AHSA1/START domain
VDKIIHVSKKLNCNKSRAFRMFTDNRSIEKWLASLAEVEPRVGGKYELFWNPNDRDNDSTIGCKVLALEENKLIAFEWKGPKEFKDLNEERPLTNVIVSFFPDEDDRCYVHLIHNGWRNSERWNMMYDYFVRNWNTAFDRLDLVVKNQ